MKRILVIDDEEPVVKAMKEVLDGPCRAREQAHRRESPTYRPAQRAHSR